MRFYSVDLISIVDQFIECALARSHAYEMDIKVLCAFVRFIESISFVEVFMISFGPNFGIDEWEPEH